MYDKFKKIAASNSWVFFYGRTDFANLYDAEHTQKVVMFLDPIQTNPNYNEYGQKESITYTGSFVLAISSDFDEESYDTRYQTYIKPLIETSLALVEQDFNCGSYSIDSINTVEIINFLDFQADGIAVTYSITHTL